MSTAAKSIIRDIIYLDTLKAESLLSQLREGLQTTASATEERGTGGGVDARLSVGPFGVGGTKRADSRQVHAETWIPHHYTLVALEDELKRLGVMTEICQANAAQIEDPESRSELQSKPFIRAEGWPSLEQYGSLGKFAADTNVVMEFGRACTLSSSEEYKQVAQQLESLRQQVRSERDREKRGRAERRLKGLQDQLASTLREGLLDPAFVEGIAKFTEVVMPDLFCLRLHVDRDDSARQILCNLKRKWLVSYEDFWEFVYDYGVYPDIPLTVLGLATSVPTPKYDYATDFRHPRSSEDTTPEQESEPLVNYERALRNLFPTWAAVGQFGRFLVFPRVMVSPIAVYRTAKTTE